MVADPVPPALVAATVNVQEDAYAVVPVITPVVVFIVNPGGSPVALKLVGEFVAIIW
jgi:hypothetical protein